jgi:protocatechuate 3,4-dioxygenase alpha subunit
VDPRPHLIPTASQTIGPYFGFALPSPDGPFVVDSEHEGALWIRGRVTDGAGEPISDALVETWQADAAGAFPADVDDGGKPFRGFGRCPTDRDGAYGIRTVKPGPVAGPDGGPQAPHIDVLVFMRGLLRPVVTRIYFPGDPRNEADALLASLPVERRKTLIAQPSADGYRFEIRMQGEGETAFFDL